ncbi:MAG: M56 family metallopeptidase [Oscillospiraceae bacterium]|nr:M56 family metallopeptidase [Oscillospiraceae bacterium]
MLIANTIAPIFYKLLYMSVTALVAGMIIMLIRRFADKRFSPFWKYTMWVLVLFALIMPWRPQSNLAVMNTTEKIQQISFYEEYNQAITEYQDAQIAHVGGKIIAPEPSEQVTEAKAKMNLLYIKTLIFDEIIPVAWLSGAILIALFMLFSGLRIGRKIRGSEISLETERYENILQSCKQRLGIKRRVQIVMQNYVKTPALFGLFRPKIILPEYVESLSDEHLEYVILHELSHLKRGDSIVNTLLLALQTVYWFNPLTWVLFKFIREDMELANDAAVLKGMNAEEQKEYSLSLVEVLVGYSKPALTPRLLCMVDSEKNMMRRINMIKLGEFFKRRRLIIAVCAAAIIAGTAILFLTASGGNFSTSNWEIYTFADENYKRVFFECNDSPYNPEYISIDAQLMNTQIKNGIGYEEAFILVKQIGDEWKIVPFANKAKINPVSYDLEIGSSFNYIITPEKLAVKLDEGQYRIVTYLYPASQTPHMTATGWIRHTVWAEFKIDKNAPKQETFTIPSEWFGNSKWFGNFDDNEMTIDELREIVKNISELTMKDLMKYCWINLSSDFRNYNALFSIEKGSLQVIADSDYIISRMDFKIKEADTALDLLKEPERFDDYFSMATGRIDDTGNNGPTDF